MLYYGKMQLGDGGTRIAVVQAADDPAAEQALRDHFGIQETEEADEDTAFVCEALGRIEPGVCLDIDFLV